eukprot:TRINITY_DN39439_c0_g1_i1.p1 TRINITY_DN39439_c0_g1~~TRINITY_DN39439_c0_g1_i1.p1  ORF type:complete len:340 (-),score=44.04 TRINITY_DN39439_c0_g1_i1:248-1234(-)
MAWHRAVDGSSLLQPHGRERDSELYGWNCQLRIHSTSMARGCLLLSVAAINLVQVGAQGLEHPQGVGPQSLWPTPVLTLREALPSNGHMTAHIRSLAAPELAEGLAWRSGSNTFLKDLTHGSGDVAAAALAVQKLVKRSLKRFFVESLQKRPTAVDSIDITIEESWASVGTPIESQAPHVHAQAGVVGTYYLECNGAVVDERGVKIDVVDVQDEKKDQQQTGCCVVTLEDPRAPAALSDLPPPVREKLGFGTPKRLCMRAGSVLIYPAWLVHAAMPRRALGSTASGSKAERIAISFVAGVHARASVAQSGASGAGYASAPALQNLDEL